MTFFVAEIDFFLERLLILILNIVVGTALLINVIDKFFEMPKNSNLRSFNSKLSTEQFKNNTVFVNKL